MQLGKVAIIGYGTAGQALAVLLARAGVDVEVFEQAPAPGPVAIAKGKQPRMKAKEVIKIGRRRRRAASTAAVTTSIPFSSIFILAYSTIKIAFFAARPIKVIIPTCI